MNPIKAVREYIAAPDETMPPYRAEMAKKPKGPPRGDLPVQPPQRAWLQAVLSHPGRWVVGVRRDRDGHGGGSPVRKVDQMNVCSECGGIGGCKVGCAGPPAPSGVLEIPCTAWEKGLIEKCAAISGEDPADWALDAALKRAHEVVDRIADQVADGGAA